MKTVIVTFVCAGARIGTCTDPREVTDWCVLNSVVGAKRHAPGRPSRGAAVDHSALCDSRYFGSDPALQEVSFKAS